MSVVHGVLWNNTDKERPLAVPVLSTTNPTCFALVLNTCLRGGEPTNYLSCSTEVHKGEFRKDPHLQAGLMWP
jgi:hypothetical protein